MTCAIVLASGLVAPLRATNINVSTPDCQQTDQPQTDLIRTAGGIATLDNVDTPREVICSVPRSPIDFTKMTVGAFYIDGDMRNGASMSCAISSYAWTGVLQGTASFSTTIAAGVTDYSWFENYLTLPPELLGFWNYVTFTCLLPAHGNGRLRGVTAGQ